MVFNSLFFGIALTIIIISIWQPKFEGTYEYNDCSNARKVNGKVVDTDDCEKKEGNLAKRNRIYHINFISDNTCDIWWIGL